MLDFFFGLFSHDLAIDLGTPVERSPFPKLTALRHGVASTGRAEDGGFSC